MNLLLILFVYSFILIKPSYAMHISEGILPFNWAALWFAIAIPFLIKGVFDIKKKTNNIAAFKSLLGLMAALIFIISCMPVPVPTAGTCSHPAGTGISAILLGPVMSVFIASISLFFQALFMAHGGITTWGANIVSMGIAGSFAAWAVFKILRKLNASLFVSAFAAGVTADWVTYITTSFELASALHGTKPMLPLFYTILIAFIPTQLPLGILEGFLTGGMIIFVYKRRPDILASLGVIEKSEVCLSTPAGKQRSKSKNYVFWFIILIFGFWLLNSSLSVCAETKWGGVDESVVEKVAEENGRPPCEPFINTDQGDLLLFVFLLAGAAGGFVMGYNYRKLFGEKNE